MEKIINTDNVSIWAQTLFIIAIPNLVLGFIMNYSLPELSSRLLSYPATLTEEQQDDVTDKDQEKGIDAKDYQLKGKLANTLINFVVLLLFLFVSVEVLLSTTNVSSSATSQVYGSADDSDYKACWTQPAFLYAPDCLVFVRAQTSPFNSTINSFQIYPVSFED